MIYNLPFSAEEIEQKLAAIGSIAQEKTVHDAEVKYTNNHILIQLDYAISDGTTIMFRVPEPTGISAADLCGLDITDNNGTAEFILTDANGGDIGQLAAAFASGSIVKVILDTVNNKAFIQNADTNSYIENQLAEISANLEDINSELAAVGGSQIKIADIYITPDGGYDYEQNTSYDTILGYIQNSEPFVCRVDRGTEGSVRNFDIFNNYDAYPEDGYVIVSRLTESGVVEELRLLPNEITHYYCGGTDSSLSLPNRAANAKAVGDALKDKVGVGVDTDMDQGAITNLIGVGTNNVFIEPPHYIDIENYDGFYITTEGCETNGDRVIPVATFAGCGGDELTILRNIAPGTADSDAVTVAQLNDTIDAIEIGSVTSTAVVNVKDSGAKGDGSTDDTAAIREARAKAIEENKALYFPAGTYLVSGSIELWSDCEIYGEGSKTIIKKVPAITQLVTSFDNSNNIFTVVDASKYEALVDCDCCATRDRATKDISIKGIIRNIDKTKNTITVDIIQENCGTDFATAVTNGKVKFSSTFSVFCAYEQYAPIHDVYIHDITIDGSRTNDEPYNYELAAIHFTGLSNTGTVDNFRYIEHPYENIRIENVNIEYSPADGISVQSAKNVCITNCITENCGLNGVHLGVGTDIASVTGCKLNADFCGYYDCADVGSVSLTGNHFENCYCGVGGLDQYTNGLTITGNTFRGCAYGINAGVLPVPARELPNELCTDGMPDMYKLYNADSITDADTAADTYHAYCLSVAGHGVSISGNAFYGVAKSTVDGKNNVTAVDRTGVGIVIFGGNTSTIIGNTFHNLAAAFELANAQRIHISDNTIHNCGTTLSMSRNKLCYYLRGTDTRDCTFTDNTVLAEAIGSSADLNIQYAENIVVKDNTLKGNNADSFSIAEADNIFLNEKYTVTKNIHYYSDILTALDDINNRTADNETINTTLSANPVVMVDISSITPKLTLLEDISLAENDYLAINKDLDIVLNGNTLSMCKKNDNTIKGNIIIGNGVKVSIDGTSYGSEVMVNNVSGLTANGVTLFRVHGDLAITGGSYTAKNIDLGTDKIASALIAASDTSNSISIQDCNITFVAEGDPVNSSSNVVQSQAKNLDIYRTTFNVSAPRVCTITSMSKTSIFDVSIASTSVGNSDVITMYPGVNFDCNNLQLTQHGAATSMAGISMLKNTVLNLKNSHIYVESTVSTESADNISGISSLDDSTCEITNSSIFVSTGVPTHTFGIDNYGDLRCTNVQIFSAGEAITGSGSVTSTGCALPVKTILVAANKAGCTAGEIYNYLKTGGNVQLLTEEGLYYRFLRAEQECAYFGYIADECIMYSIIVGADGTIERYEHELVNTGTLTTELENSLGDISAALDHIITLQEELINL